MAHSTAAIAGKNRPQRFVPTAIKRACTIALPNILLPRELKKLKS
jgi:hypothetical protein